MRAPPPSRAPIALFFSLSAGRNVQEMISRYLATRQGQYASDFTYSHHLVTVRPITQPEAGNMLLVGVAVDGARSHALYGHLCCASVMHVWACVLARANDDPVCLCDSILGVEINGSFRRSCCALGDAARAEWSCRGTCNVRCI